MNSVMKTAAKVQEDAKKQLSKNSDTTLKKKKEESTEYTEARLGESLKRNGKAK
jgi:hypothetical protein